MSAQLLLRSSPEEQGVSSQSILNFIEELEAKKIDMHSFMYLRHSKVIAEGWWKPYQPEYKKYVYSMSKSFTSTAVGLAVAEGLLNVNDRVVSFFPDELPEEIGENLAVLRVKDLLSMTSGHDFDTLMPILTPDSDHWVKAILSLPVNREPGTFFLYNTGATYLLSAIVQKVTGETVFDLLSERVFRPLDISDVTWDACPQGINCGGWGLSIRTEDIAKFGLLYLQKGVWNGKEILPAEWIEEATIFPHPALTEDHIDEADWHQGYGYQFWGCQHEAYRADGAKGQFCVVMPGQDVVIAITSETEMMQVIMDQVWKHLFPAMQDRPLPADLAALKSLRQKLSSLNLAPTASGSIKKPKPAQRQSFKIKENGAGIQSLALEFNETGCYFHLVDGQGDHAIQCGNREWVINETRMPGMLPTMFSYLLEREKKPVKVAAMGTWIDDQTYQMRWQYLETPHYDLVSCHFEGTEIDLEFCSHFGELEPFILPGIEKQFKGMLE